jgi:hypothetical protein
VQQQQAVPHKAALVGRAGQRKQQQQAG